MSEASERARTTWSAGNWDEVSKLLPPVGQVVLDYAGVDEGMDVIDVGCGSGGTVAIPAAQRGANVTGADVTPELFEDARRRAAEAGVEVNWVEAPAADMPFEDGSFDRVMSTFGHMFEADQASAAAELVRICKPGGMIVCACWTPEGFNGRMFATTGKHMPPPPPGFTPPILWGTEDRWRELVGSQGVDLEFHREHLEMKHEAGVDEFFDEFASNFGPLVMARGALGDDGFAALRADMVELYGEGNQATDGGTLISAEYLVAVGRKPS